MRAIKLTPITITDSAEAAPQTLRQLQAAKADAILLTAITTVSLLQDIVNLKVPTILIDHHVPNVPLATVMNDSYGGALEAMRYLIECKHRRIAFIDGLAHYTIQRRYAAYRDALKEAGIKANDAWVLPGQQSYDGGFQAAVTFTRQNNECTAAFCANDSTALGFLQGLTLYGKQVPHDVSVIGFDDVALARFSVPPLTTIRANPAEIGRVAVQEVLARAEEPNLPPTIVTVPTQLIKRDSVRVL